MSLTDLPIPPRPDYFGPDGAPPGIDLRLDVYGAWARGRPTIKPRVGIVHTNAASVEASVQSSINYGNADSDNTKPHYLLGDKPAKVLRTDKRGIANSTTAAVESQYGEIDCSFWTFAIETADVGSVRAKEIGIDWPRDCGPFLYGNAELVARIFAYESIVWGIPVQEPPEWNGTGFATHTDPYPFPYYTIRAGKTCPGATKIRQFRYDIMPRVRQLVDAWTAPEEADMAGLRVVKLRFDGYAEQLVCFRASADTLTTGGIVDDNVVVIAEPTDEQRAAIEYELGRSLSKLP